MNEDNNVMIRGLRRWRSTFCDRMVCLN